MFTSNFKACWHNANAVAISIGIPRGWKGRRYLKLAPSKAMLKLPEAEFQTQYREILAKLDAKIVYAELGDDAILLCWEAFNDCCHRRMVAEWFEKKLKVVIPEFGHKRIESVTYEAAAEKLRAKEKRKNHLPLFDP